MTFKTPTLSQLRDAAEALGIEPSDDYLRATQEIVKPLVDAYRALEEMPDEIPEVRYPRTPGYRPDPAENPHGAWYQRTEIKGRARGKLAGKRIALKDNICLAGVPMMNGASTFEGYVPDVDATIVERILDAGGTIAGKVVCEYYCVSGGSHTSATGPVHNPRKRGYSAGGSSSGSAAVVAAGDVEMAIGGDQAGSIRIPASHCGAYGLKPTYGLVPYTGIIPLEVTVDHTGPITATVADNALLLEVIAGADEFDSRQGAAKAGRYTQALDKGVKGLRIGIVQEGFGHDNAESAVEDKVRKAIQRLRRLGAEVEAVSVPAHNMAMSVWAPIVHEGGFLTMFTMNGVGTAHQGLYVGSLHAAGAAWRQRADEFADTIKIMALFGQHALANYHGRHYAKAQNVRRRLRRAYDEAFARFDLLAMPTVPFAAKPIPRPDASVDAIASASWDSIANTCPFNVTGHPAISVPCGLIDGRPAGLMLVGRHHEEATIYRAAAAFERIGDWQKM